MNYRCPIYNGKGMVEPDFGRGVTGGVCPGCDGTGMQWKNEPMAYQPFTFDKKQKPCRKAPSPECKKVMFG